MIFTGQMTQPTASKHNNQHDSTLVTNTIYYHLQLSVPTICNVLTVNITNLEFYDI